MVKVAIWLYMILRNETCSLLSEIFKKKSSQLQYMYFLVKIDFCSSDWDCIDYINHMAGPLFLFDIL